MIERRNKTNWSQLLLKVDHAKVVKTQPNFHSILIF
jgi:hypothetical protein